MIEIEGEDSGVCVDLSDSRNPIMVERDGWMALEDAIWLRDLLNKAIDIAVKAHGDRPINAEGTEAIVSPTKDGEV